MNQTFAAQGVKRINATEFVNEVANSPIPVMLTFTAGGCSSCGKMLGTLETMVKVYNGRIKFLYIDTSEAGTLLLNYRRGGTPLSVLLVNGKVAKSKLIQTQEPNFPNEAVWLGNAMYIQYFVQFLDSVLHAINTKQLSD
mgnify:FL=1